MRTPKLFWGDNFRVWGALPILKSLTLSVFSNPTQPPVQPTTSWRFGSPTRPALPHRLVPLAAHIALMLAPLGHSWLLPKPTAGRSFERNSPCTCWLCLLKKCSWKLRVKTLYWALKISSVKRALPDWWFPFNTVKLFLWKELASFYVISFQYRIFCKNITHNRLF